MAFNGNNQWALILGGSSGIGLATAKKLSSEGLNICIVHRDIRSRMQLAEKSFEEIRSGGSKLLTYNVDASNQEVIKELSETIMQKLGHGKIKVLVHAISKGNLKSIFPNEKKKKSKGGGDDLVQKFRELDDLMTDHHDKMGVLRESDVTITQQAMSSSLIYWCQELLERKLFSDSARVIALTSEGNKRIWHSYVAIALAKASLEALIKYLAKELAPHGITANIIQAGITDTPSLRMIPGNEVIRASTVNRNPFGRLTQPEDVANFIYLICTDEAAWVNGALIPVDGGEHFC